jgi:hypothetical protein
MTWTSVKDKFPHPEDQVLVWDGDSITIARINSYRGKNGEILFCPDSAPSFEGSHWMPLPKPPGEA